MADELIKTLRWQTRPSPFDPEGRIVMVNGAAADGRLADYNMAFTGEEIAQNSPYFFEVMLERMQETILEFIS